jgi:hypothetical protein
MIKKIKDYIQPKIGFIISSLSLLYFRFKLKAKDSELNVIKKESDEKSVIISALQVKIDNFEIVLEQKEVVELVKDLVVKNTEASSLTGVVLFFGTIFLFIYGPSIISVLFKGVASIFDEGDVVNDSNGGESSNDSSRSSSPPNSSTSSTPNNKNSIVNSSSDGSSDSSEME